MSDPAGSVIGRVARGQRRVPLWVMVLRRSFADGRMRVGLGLTLLIVLLVIFGPLLAPHAPDALLGQPYASPSNTALLGTDYLGQDVLSRVLWGGQSVLWISAAATMLGVGLGVLVGLFAGYSRNWLDEVLMRPLDVVYAFPQIVLSLLFISMVGPKLWLVVLLVALAWMPGVARVTRGITIDTVSKEFVEAAEVLGVPRRRILLKEVLPNLTTPLMVEFGLRLTWSIGLVAALSFIGFGIQPPHADWGLMINENRNGLTIQPWAVVVPVCCIAVFTIGTNLITEGLSRTIAGVDRRGGHA
jgi:peptide/nickel transport system permease protein